MSEPNEPIHITMSGPGVVVDRWIPEILAAKILLLLLATTEEQAKP